MWYYENRNDHRPHRLAPARADISTISTGRPRFTATARPSTPCSFVFHASLSRQGHLADLWGTHIATNAELAFMLYKRVKVYFKRASPYHFLALSIGFELFMLTIHSSIVEPPVWGRTAFKTLKRHLWQWDTFVVQVRASTLAYPSSKGGLRGLASLLTGRCART